MNNTEILTKADAIRAMRNYICDEIRKQKKYNIKIDSGSGVPKRYLKQYYPSWAYSEFCINVVNGNFSFSLEMRTYPDCVGRYDSEHHSFTAEEFHEIAVECNFPKMYEFMESEEDWKQIDNGEFREALAELEEYLKAERELEFKKNRIAKAALISDDMLCRKPKMNIDELDIDNVFFVDGNPSLNLNIENGKYEIYYINHYSENNKVLTSAESVWLEKKVNDALMSSDTSEVYSPFLMNIKIVKNGSVEVNYNKQLNSNEYYYPLLKYYRLYKTLCDFLKYGSITEEEKKQLEKQIAENS